MSQITNPNSGERVIFLELFKRHSIVEIPIIQRDYVQGRKSELEVRTEFLKALHTALSKPVGDSSLPLDLDFVYGSVEGTEQPAFCPLDGQQRLTTLFLLHWYLAWQNGRDDDFAAHIKIDKKSRFSYAVRPSSHEFFDALVCWYPDTITTNDLSLSDSIMDQPWFFRSWKLDPTIQSALEILDALHARFTSAEGFYDRLVQAEHPYITFQLLDLRSFGLSDDLYIKMNARGKPLTPFETFKARLEQYLDTIFPEEKLELHGKQVSIKNYFSHQIDTAWADLFWQHRDKKTHLFDDRIMHLIRALAIVTRDPDRAGIDRVLQSLRNNLVSFSFLTYQELQCLDRTHVETLIAVLDEWCGEGGGIRTHLPNSAYFDEKRIFDKVIKSSTELTYEELVQFHAYCVYLTQHRSGLQKDAFGDWMRVIRNLAINTTYDRLDDFKRSIRSVNELLNDSSRILDHLSSMAVVRGFNEQQIREEKLKAQLIHRSDEWRSLILETEQHGYFNGQIEFLFKFSGILDRWMENYACNWSDEEDASYRQAFADNFAKASMVFSANGLKNFGENRWERALLSIGDYLIWSGSNYSFLVNSDRDVSWKRLLRGSISTDSFFEPKRGYVKKLFDLINLKIGVEESLNKVIEQANPTDEWRRVIVKNPKTIEFCGKRMIRKQSNDCIYLLKKIRMSGEHAELFTYHLKVSLLSEKDARGELTPFGLVYNTVNTDSEDPSARLTCRCRGVFIVMDIFNKSASYELKLFSSNTQLPDQLAAELTNNFTFNASENGLMLSSVPRGNIEESIDTVVSIIRKFASTPDP